MTRFFVTRSPVARVGVRSVAATLAVLILTVSTANAAIGPKLVKDIFTGSGDGNPDELVALGTRIIFEAIDATHGRELWKTDGTASGTKLVKDINPSGDSSPGDFVKLGSFIYFAADDGVHGREIWRTDGSAAGTTMVKDINLDQETVSAQANLGSDPTELHKIGSTLVFYANDGDHGSEPWKTTGTAKSTKMLADINTGPGDSFECCIKEFGSLGAFSAFNGSDFDFWRTNGTSAGTFELQSLGSQRALDVVAAGVNLFFTVDLGSTEGLYLSDGSDVDLLVELINISYPAALGNGVFFSGDEGINGREPWFSNGTEAGTDLLANINTEDLSSEPRSWNHTGAINGLVFFQATDPNHGRELWKTNGTPAGTTLVEDINPTGDSGDGANYREPFGNRLYFVADDGVHGEEPWISDGTANGTMLLKDIRAGGATSDPTDGAVVSGLLFFNAETANAGVELWRTDGTPSGTRRLTDINSGAADSNPIDRTAIGGTLYFRADDGIHGEELYRYVP